MKGLKIGMMAVLFLPLMACGGGAGETAQSQGEAQVQTSDKNMVIETIMARRSIRKYMDQPVEREKLQTIVECGINAPNGGNKQPWEIRVVDNPEYINGVTELFKKANPKMAEDPDFKNMFRNATAVIFIGRDTTSSSAEFDCGLLAENMMLAAQSMGLGSCCLGGPIRFMKSPEAADYINKLAFSEGYDLLYCVGFGYPAESPDAKPRDASKVKFID